MTDEIRLTRKAFERQSVHLAKLLNQITERDAEILQLKEKLATAREALEFYAKGLDEYGQWGDMPEGFRVEFGCACCAGTIVNGDNDFDKEICGLTAREALTKIGKVA